MKWLKRRSEKLDKLQMIQNNCVGV
jgi:hypothetical protein